MAVLTAPPVPPVPPLSEPMTWAAICATYPDQYVLVDQATFADGDVVSAHVLMHGVRSIDLYRMSARLRPQHPDVQDLWTGGERAVDRLFAWKLAMHRSRRG